MAKVSASHWSGDFWDEQLTVLYDQIDRVYNQYQDILWDIEYFDIRIDEAAFDRTPDGGGLGFWMDKMDNDMPLIEVAARFIDSDEFRLNYGTNPDKTWERVLADFPNRRRTNRTSLRSPAG